MPSPYELIQFEVDKIKTAAYVNISAYCTNCIFHNPHAIDQVYPCALVAKSSGLALISECIPETYALQHKVTGEILSPEQTQELYELHKREHHVITL